MVTLDVSRCKKASRIGFKFKGIIPPPEWRSSVRAVSTLRSSLKNLKRSRFSKDKQKYNLLVSVHHATGHVEQSTEDTQSRRQTETSQCPRKLWVHVALWLKFSCLKFTELCTVCIVFVFLLQSTRDLDQGTTRVVYRATVDLDQATTDLHKASGD